MTEYVLDREHFLQLAEKGEVEEGPFLWAVSLFTPPDAQVGDMVFARQIRLPAHGEGPTYWKVLIVTSGDPEVTLTQVDKVVEVSWKVRP